jgi:hypothetical protein
MSASGTLVYSFKGKKNDYLGNETYQFGRELQIAAGIADRFLLGKSIFDPAISFRLRHVLQDRLNDQKLPSTGGTWLFVNPSIQYWFHPDFSFQVGVSLPVYANVTGTQASPTYRINASFFTKIGFSKNDPGRVGFIN